MIQLQANSNRPDFFQLQRWLLADQLALVPCNEVDFGLCRNIHERLLGEEWSVSVDPAQWFYPTLCGLSNDGRRRQQCHDCGRSVRTVWVFDSAKSSPSQLHFNLTIDRHPA